MNQEEYKNYFQSLHPRPEKPYLKQYLLRPDLIFLILAAIGGVIFSASRTFTLIAEQSGSYIAAFAVLALEFSMTGLILSETRKNQGNVMNFLRASAMWITIGILLLILIVTNTSYEIRQVGLLVSEQALKIVLVMFLGVMIPVLVVINLENLASRIPEYITDYHKNLDNYYHMLAGWTEQLEDGWSAERDKEFAQDKPATAYSKEERKTFIKEQLATGKTLNKSKIAQRFGVSVTTVTNDIKDLTPSEPTKIESQF